MSETRQELLVLLATTPRGTALLANLDSCERAGLFQSNVGEEFRSRLCARTADSDSATELVAVAAEVLSELAIEYDTGPLERRFDEQYPRRFAIGRVITDAALRTWYMDPPTSRDSEGKPTVTAMGDHIRRDVEFGTYIASEIRPDWKWKPKVQLCQNWSGAFVTDLQWWDRVAQGRGEAGYADLAATLLALPFCEGEHLVMLRLTDEATSELASIRRPTLFDAIDHWLWMCWADDGLHWGHTVDLDSVSRAKLSKGGAEWVTSDTPLWTSGGAVQKSHLGPTSRSTLVDSAGELLLRFFPGPSKSGPT